MATHVAERLSLSLQNLFKGGAKFAAGGDGDCVPMAAGVAKALQGQTIPINPPAFFKQAWVNPQVLESYLAGTFKLVGKDPDSARGAILKALQEAGEGAHGVVLGQSLANQRGHVFNVTLQGGSLKVIEVSQAGTGFEGLKSIEFMLVK